MKESYQREEYCSDQRKGSLRHFQPPKNLGSNFKAMLELLLRQNRGMSVIVASWVRRLLVPSSQTRP